MIKPIRIDCNGRMIEFKMDLDPGFVADSSIGWYLAQGVPPEPEVTHLMMRVVQEGDCVVDCGANVGFFTLLLSQCVGATGDVLAFEPGSNNLPKLLDNIAMNAHAKNVAVAPKILAAKIGEQQFYLARDTGINAAWRSEHTVLSDVVETTTLDFWWPVRTPKLIKMDIEGSEFEALKGAERLLVRRPPFIVMEFNTQALAGMGTAPDDIWRFMTARGYEMFVLSEHGLLPAMVPRFSRIVVTRNNTNVLFSTIDDVGKAWSEVIV